MFPDNTIQEQINKYQAQQAVISTDIKYTPKFDYMKNIIEIKDGSPLTVEQIEAVKQWIILFVLTPKDIYSIYKGTKFGTSLRKLKGEKKLINNGYVEAELERELKEGLPLCPAIKQLTDFDLNKNGRYLELFIQVELYNGSLIDVTIEEKYIFKGY